MASPTDRDSWQRLSAHFRDITSDKLTLSSLFEDDPSRFDRFSIDSGELFLDYSKQLVTDETMRLLLGLAESCDLAGAIEAMYRGDPINRTEERPALHVALRACPSGVPEQVRRQVADALGKMNDFIAAVHGGQWLGHTGKPITDVVNIGIGGSDLGPAMVNQALTPFHLPGLRAHFVSNVDPNHMLGILEQVRPETTLFIVASKSFTTLETLQNALLARKWFLDQLSTEHGDSQPLVGRHFVAVTSNIEKAAEFGINADNIFPMWDWVGGRYSLWSAIGLPVALATGMDRFRELLDGARLMDEHFRLAPLDRNIPVIMGLLNVWYGGFFGATSQVVLPYSQHLHLLPSFLQQLDMESLGKSVDLDGNPLSINSGLVVWGSAGTNGQHSFHQLLHQGTHLIPADFIAVARPGSPEQGDQHAHLLANCFSQSQALMQGKSTAEAIQELEASGMNAEKAQELAKHKVIKGNRPSSTLLLQQLTPRSLGSLIAAYEHRVYVQSVIWNINAFDQWGVELGKQLSGELFRALTARGDEGDPTSNAAIDGSSAGLIKRCRNALT